MFTTNFSSRVRLFQLHDMAGIRDDNDIFIILKQPRIRPL